MRRIALRRGPPGIAPVLVLGLAALLVLGGTPASPPARWDGRAPEAPALDPKIVRAMHLGNPSTDPERGLSAVLQSVSISPSGATLLQGGSVPFSPLPSCSPGPCPAGISYTWTLNGNIGGLGYTNSNTLLPPIPAGENVPTGIAYDSENGDLYVTNDDPNGVTTASNVSVYSTETDLLVGSIPVGVSPSGIAYDPANGDLYVADCGSNQVSVIDGLSNTVVATLSMPLVDCTIGKKWYMNFAPVDYDPADGTIYVSNYGSGQVSVLNPSTDQVVASLALGGSPYDMAFDPEDGDMYITLSNSTAVAVIDGANNTLVSEVVTAVFPSGITYDPVNGDVYIADSGIYVRNPSGPGNISVLNATTGTIVDTIRLGGYPWFLAYDSSNGCIYETDSNTSMVRIISPTTNSVIGEVDAGGPAQGGSNAFMDLYDGANGRLYLSGINYHTVSVLGGVSDPDVFTAEGTVGNGTLSVRAEWNGTVVQSLGVPIAVQPSPVPVILSLSISPEPVRPGESAFVNTTGVGGDGTLRYAYAGLPPGCLSSDFASLRCDPSALGNFTIRAYVNDSAGHSANATAELFVLPPVPNPSQSSPPGVAGFLGSLAADGALVLGVACIVAVVVPWLEWRARRRRDVDPPVP
jgi:YVTN family beta-propeller protein